MTSAMSGGAATIGRGGVAIAMSTGLAASVGLPTAAAAGQTAELSPVKASPAVDQAMTLLSLPQSASADPVEASAGATLNFAGGTGTFTAVPKPKPVVKERAVERTSRSTTRSSGSATGSTKSDPVPSSSDASGSSILAIAARYAGTPYVFGGEDPSGFDCSGYTQYVFKKVGISLPRTSSQQYAAVRHVSASAAKPGNLVFFLDGGGVYHVGIYAGNGMMWDSPKPGGVVSKRKIWSATIRFGVP